MKYEYYCSVNEDHHVLEYLNLRNIKYDVGPIGNRCYFTIYSDTDGSDQMIGYIKALKDSSITKSIVFSKNEMESANWYLVYVYRMGIGTSNPDFTYESKCPFSDHYGMQRYRHLYQVNPFVSKRAPKWKKGYQICSVDTGFKTTIFCSDYAKDIIRKSSIKGVDFIPVLKETSKQNLLTYRNLFSLTNFRLKHIDS